MVWCVCANFVVGSVVIVMQNMMKCEEVINCSICLELVEDDGSRSKAKLQCGHEFHLDCIGSAFNVKGIMQCPNCRSVEKGQWMYAVGSANLASDISMNSWMAEQYPFFLVPYGFCVCPFRGFMQMDNLSPAGHAFYENHDNFTEQMPPSSTGLAYFPYSGLHPHASLNHTDHRDGSYMTESSHHQSTLNLRATGGELDAATGSRFSGHALSSQSVYAFGGVQSPYPFSHHHHPVGTSLPFPPGVRRSNGLRASQALSHSGHSYDPRATFYHPSYLSPGYNFQATESHIPNYSHPWGRGVHFPVQPFVRDSDQWIRH